jgi:dihydrofolate reductase
MGKVRCHMTMTIDGYVAGPNQRVDAPFGDGAERLNDWMFQTRTFHELSGADGGDEDPSDDVLRERLADVGATIMGRNMFGGGPGPWGDDPWTGWWGDEPPYHTPVFVLTHHPRPPLEMRGGTTFHFVTDGIAPALQRARAAAGSRDVVIGGGADLVRQCLRAGAIDELELHLVPLLLAGGERLFDDSVHPIPRLRQARSMPGAGVTHVKLQVLR